MDRDVFAEAFRDHQAKAEGRILGVLLAGLAGSAGTWLLADRIFGGGPVLLSEVIVPVLSIAPLVVAGAVAHRWHRRVRAAEAPACPACGHAFVREQHADHAWETGRCPSCGELIIEDHGLVDAHGE